jgi:hypothetical protein
MVVASLQKFAKIKIFAERMRRCRNNHLSLRRNPVRISAVHPELTSEPGTKCQILTTRHQRSGEWRGIAESIQGDPQCGTSATEALAAVQSIARNR